MTNPKLGAVTILLVEDAAALLTAARRILERDGYTVIHAPDAEAALVVAAAHPDPIQLLLTDVNMPGMGGRQLAERLREARPELRILFMSGMTDDPIILQGAFKTGGGFLQKPFAPADLSRKVRELLAVS